MEILTSILGIKTEYEKWDKKDYLPLYVSEGYEFSYINLDEKRCVLIEPIGEVATIPTLKKQIARIQEVENVPVIVFQKTMTALRRKNMIEKRLPFITEKQVYLPFMGTYLEKQAQEPTTISKLTASTQQLLLLYLYSDEKKIYVSEATKLLPFTAMTMSRAVKQFEALELFNIVKEGVNIVIEGRYSKRELFEKVKPYMSSPVLYSGYIESQYVTNDMKLAGITALSEKSMLNDDKVRTYAVGRNFDKALLVNEMVDPNNQIKLEIWKYSPNLFTNGKSVDALSLVLSFNDTTDERIEGAIAELINNTLGEK